MNNVHFFEMTVSGAFIIMVIVLIRALAINRLPKRTFLFLWGAALLRLLVPFTVSSRISIYTFLNRLKPAEKGTEPVYLPGTEMTEPAASISVITILWLGGFLLCALLFLAAYIISFWKLRGAVPVSSAALDTWTEKQGLRRPLQIRHTSRIASPLTYGVFRPVILLPEEMELQKQEELRYILTHEMVHIRRFDALTKVILAAAVCLHWFNPLVWVLYILANRDLEISCDEAVLRILGQGEKCTYARVLVGMEEQKQGIFVLASHFSKNALEERIIAVLKSTKISRAGLLAYAALFLAAVMVFSTSALAANDAGSIPRPDSSPMPGITVPPVTEPVLPEKQETIPEKQAESQNTPKNTSPKEETQTKETQKDASPEEGAESKETQLKEPDTQSQQAGEEWKLIPVPEGYEFAPDGSIQKIQE